MRSGVPLGRLREILATNSLAGGAASSSEEEGGTHRETRASSRGASSQVAGVARTAGPSGFSTGSDCADAAGRQQGISSIKRERRLIKIMVILPGHNLRVGSLRPHLLSIYQCER